MSIISPPRRPVAGSSGRASPESLISKLHVYASSSSATARAIVLASSEMKPRADSTPAANLPFWSRPVGSEPAVALHDGDPCTCTWRTPGYCGHGRGDKGAWEGPRARQVPSTIT